MSSRTESSPGTPATDQPQAEPSHREEVRQNAIDLAVFLNTARIDCVKVTSVIPSTHPDIGVLYTVELGRMIIDPDGVEAVLWYTADNASIDLLQNSLDLMSKKKRKRNKQAIRNLKLIEDTVSNPSYWNRPFNPDLLS